MTSYVPPVGKIAENHQLFALVADPYAGVGLGRLKGRSPREVR